MFEGPRGPIVVYPGQGTVMMVDLAAGLRSWWTMTHSGETGEFVGALRSARGDVTLLTAQGGYRVYGNFDGDDTAGEGENGTAVRGFFLGRALSPPEASPVVRRIDVASDSGGAVLCALRGEEKTGTNTQTGQIVGTAVWSTGNAEEPPSASKRFHFATRTDDVALCVGAEQPLSRVDPVVYVETRGPGKTRRPR